MTFSKNVVVKVKYLSISFKIDSKKKPRFSNHYETNHSHKKSNYEKHFLKAWSTFLFKNDK